MKAGSAFGKEPDGGRSVSQETGRAHIAHPRPSNGRFACGVPVPVSLSSSPLPRLLGRRVPAPAAEDRSDDPRDEHVVVTSTRLDDKAVPRKKMPGLRHGSRSRADRGQRRTEPFRTCSPRKPGVALIDQVGNDVQKTLDLRGFTGGKGVAVFVDGARVNDPRNNSVALEQMPARRDRADRDHARTGGGARRRRRGGRRRPRRHAPRTRRPRRSVSASAGTWNTRATTGPTAADYGRFDLFVAGTLRHDRRFPAERRRRPDAVRRRTGVSISASDRRLSSVARCRPTSTTEIPAR